MKRLHASLIVATVVVAGLLAACSGGALSGTWTGSVQSNDYGSVPLSVTISQSGDSLSGNWTMGAYDTGSLTGSVSGTKVGVTLSSTSDPGCLIAVAGTVSGNSMSGQFANGPSCSSSDYGTFSVSK